MTMAPSPADVCSFLHQLTSRSADPLLFLSGSSALRFPASTQWLLQQGGWSTKLDGTCCVGSLVLSVLYGGAWLSIISAELCSAQGLLQWFLNICTRVSVHPLTSRFSVGVCVLALCFSCMALVFCRKSVTGGLLLALGFARVGWLYSFLHHPPRYFIPL